MFTIILLIFRPRRAVAVRGDDLTNRRGPLSVDPRNGHPLWCRVHALDRGLQLGDRLVEVVVDDRQVEEVAVRLLQHVRFFRQPFQTAVELKREREREKKLRLLLIIFTDATRSLINIDLKFTSRERFTYISEYYSE